MKKIMLSALWIILLVSGLVLSATPVSREEAEKVAVAWYRHIVPASTRDFTVRDVYPSYFEGITVFYTFVFNSGGFVIVAADDACIPILGYSEVSDFPAEISCPSTKEWLDGYCKEIFQIIKTGVDNRETMPQWDAIRKGNFPSQNKDIGPLLTTTWGQGCQYNALCPLEPAMPPGFCGHTASGCTATSMGQIMKYHNHPTQGVGQYSYIHPVYGSLAADFGNTTYNWAEMPDKVILPNIHVATLLCNAGVAVTMDYGILSGNTGDPARAYTDFFNYHPGLEWHGIDEYPDQATWKNMLRADLDNLLPVQYIGWDIEEGHSFVCDGYRMIDEKFHFNWGWNGDFDGWFAIGSLNPGSSHFNLHNWALFHLKPYNPDLVVRIAHPSHTLRFEELTYKVGEPVTIEAYTVKGIPDKMFITIDGIIMVSGSSESLSYTWSTLPSDIGSHEVRAWAVAGSDSVYYPVVLNLSDWRTQSSGFDTPLRYTSYLSAVDSNTAWAVALDGIRYMNVECQDFTRTENGGESWHPGTISGCEGLAPAMIFGINAEKACAVMYKVEGNNLPGIYSTTDKGITWNHQTTALFGAMPDCVHFFDENEGWCMGDPGGGEFEIYTTDNGGMLWHKVTENKIPDALPNEGGIPLYSAVHDTLWFGTSKGRIYRSTDRGQSWSVFEVTGMSGEFVTPVFRNGLHGLAHNFFNRQDTGWVCETFDGGETWSLVEAVGPLQFIGLNYIPGTANTWVSTGNLFQNNSASVSYDGGHSWEFFPGTKGAFMYQMAWVNPRCGWAGGFNLNATEGGVFKFEGDLHSYAGVDTPAVPGSPFVVRCYPNPAHGVSGFGFRVSGYGHVTLKIYDLQGREVAVVLDERMPAGEHTVRYDVSGLSAGIYLVRLTVITAYAGTAGQRPAANCKLFVH
jgi:hypothetical protein